MFKMIDYVEVKSVKDIPDGVVAHEEIENKKNNRIDTETNIIEEAVKMEKVTLEDIILKERLEEVENIKEIPSEMELEELLIRAFQDEYSIDLEKLESMEAEDRIDLIIQTLGLSDEEVIKLSDLIDRIEGLVDTYQNSESLQERFEEGGFRKALLFRSLDSVLDTFETVFELLG